MEAAIGPRPRPLPFLPVDAGETSGRHPFHIATGAKRTSRAGQNDRVDIVIGAHIDPDLFELMMHDIVNRVERVGPIDGDGGDAIGNFHFEEFVFAVVDSHDDDLLCLSTSIQLANAICLTRRADIESLEKRIHDALAERERAVHRAGTATLRYE